MSSSSSKPVVDDPIQGKKNRSRPFCKIRSSKFGLSLKRGHRGREGNKNLLQSTESSVFQWQISANKFRYKTSIKIRFNDRSGREREHNECLHCSELMVHKFFQSSFSRVLINLGSLPFHNWIENKWNISRWKCRKGDLFSASFALFTCSNSSLIWKELFRFIWTGSSWWCFAILRKKLGLPLKESTFLLSHFPRLVSSSRKTPLNCRTRHFHFYLNSEVTTKRPKMCFCVLNGTWKPKCVHRPHWIPIKIVSSLSCLPGKLIWSSSTTGSRA